jgi:hypothetical protein
METNKLETTVKDLIKKNVLFVEEYFFTSIKKSTNNIGVDIYGNLIEIIHFKRKVLIPGLASASKNNTNNINNILPPSRTQEDSDALNYYKMTYAFGYLESINSKINNEELISDFKELTEKNKLIGGSWKEFIKLKDFEKIKEFENDKVLVIQNDAIRVIDESCQLKGIVVRRGGILLLDDNNIDIKVNFILIESGGLLQAGSKYNDRYRIKNKINIILTNNINGIKESCCVTSQYSYMVYNPGITLFQEAYSYINILEEKYKTLKEVKDYDKLLNYYLDLPKEKDIPIKKIKEKILSMSPSDYTGNPYNNSVCNKFGEKVIGVGFNGNYHLAGEVENKREYSGTWNCIKSNNSNSKVKPEDDEKEITKSHTNDNINQTTEIHIGKNELLTVNAPNNNIENSYPLCWCRLDNDIYKRGSNMIKINPLFIDDKDDNSFKQWKKGSQIVITCKTKKYTAGNDCIGMNPIWVDNKDKYNIHRNKIANREFLIKKYLLRTDKKVVPNDIKLPDQDDTFEYTGVEVATIDRLEYTKDNIFTGEIYLQKPLKFNHNSIKTIITNSEFDNLTIDTTLHVGLLTRNITIISEFIDSTNDLCNFTSDIWKKDIYCSCCNNGEFINGSIVGNYLNRTDNKDTTDIAVAAYQTKNEKDYYYYSSIETPENIVYGHWIFQTENIKGSNAVFGGHQMFMNGSSVSLDGVEMKYLGTPANFGSIGRYPVHFHLCGFTKSNKEYIIPHLPRESSIQNCSITNSFNRWIVLHGTHEANIKNNIGFISYGAGFFTEDGTEINNTFEHNLGICTLPANRNKYWNPLYIYPSIISDIGPTSTFWIKNNQNRLLRNVACNSPSPVIGIWAVPVITSKLRGLSTVCCGDEVLKLPSLCSQDTCATSMNIFKKNNINGFFMKNSSNKIGWIPRYLNTKFYYDDQNCVIGANKNSNNPYKLWAENVIYCMYGGMSEFPEAIGIPVGDYYGRGAFAGSCGENIGIELFNLKYNEDNTIEIVKNNQVEGIPQFMPYNAQNSTVYSWGTQDTYFTSCWGGTKGENRYLYQPIVEFKTNKDILYALGNEATYNIIPKVFSNWLTFNLGPSLGTLWGGAGWTKGSPTWLINCCFLSEGGGERAVNSNNNFSSIDSSNYTVASVDPKMSTIWSSVCGDGVNQYDGAIFIIHNLIVDGGIGLPPNKTIISGPKTFISSESQIYNLEFNDHKYTALNHYYFIRTSYDHWKKAFKSFKGLYRIYTVNKIINKLEYIASTDMSTIRFSDFNNEIKYPYLMNDSMKLLSISDKFNSNNGSDGLKNINYKYINNYNPEWRDIVINSQIGHFINRYGICIGNSICFMLGLIKI